MPGGLSVNGKRSPTNNRKLIVKTKNGNLNVAATKAKIASAKRKDSAMSKARKNLNKGNV
jgi:hypothetical protein